MGRFPMGSLWNSLPWRKYNSQQLQCCLYTRAAPCFTGDEMPNIAQRDCMIYLEMSSCTYVPVPAGLTRLQAANWFPGCLCNRLKSQLTAYYFLIVLVPTARG